MREEVMRDVERPVGLLGASPFALALHEAATRAGRRTMRVASACDVGAVAEMARDCQLVLLAATLDEVAGWAESLGRVCDGKHMIVHALRGLCGDGLEPVSGVLRARTPVRKLGALGGPLVPSALQAGRPSGGIVGSRYPEVGQAVRAALVSPSLRVYVTDDLVGVELGACLMGTLAMGAGFARAIGVGPSATAVLLARGVHEAANIATLWGARRETFFGLAGYGDLLAAVADDERTELQVGRLLGGGMHLPKVASAVGGTPESIQIGLEVVKRAVRSQLETPIFGALVDLAGGKPPAEVIDGLMRHERFRE